MEDKPLESTVVPEKTKELFECLITALEAYLAPLLNLIDRALLVEPVPQTVVILADHDLLEFPLECLSVFRNCDDCSVSRDFSLQFFYQRFKRGDVGESAFQFLL